MTDNVEVRFGGNTSGLDAAANKARQDIQGVGKQAEGLKGTFGSIAQSFKNMFSGGNFGDVATKMRTVRSEMKSMVEETGRGNIQLGILGRVFAEAAQNAAPLAAALMGVAVALGALYTVKKVLEFGEAMGDMALNIEKASQKLGMNAEEIQKWHGVAAQVHMDATQMDSGFTRLERSMFMAANGAKAQGQVFQELGINVRDLKSPTEALIAISEKFKDMPDGPKKTAMAMALMGRAGAQMIPVLNQGKEGLKGLMQTAEDTGSVMSNDLVGAGLAVDEQFNQLHLAGQGLRNILFEALAPAIHAVVSALVVMVKGMIASYRAGGTVYIIVKTLAAGFKVLASVVIAVGGVFATFAHLAVAAITAVFGPVYTLGAALGDIASGNFKGAVQDIKNGAKDIGASVTNSLSQAMGSIKGTGTALAGIWSNKMPKPKEPLAGEDGDMNLDGGAMQYGGGPKKGKKGKKDNSAAEAKKAAEERLRAYLQELDDEEEAAKDDYAKKIAIEDEKLAAIKKVYGQDSKEYASALRHKHELERQHAAELDQITKQQLEANRALRDSDLNADKEIASSKLQMERDRIDAEENLGKINAVQKEKELAKVLAAELALEIAHENKMYQSKMEELRAELALQHLPLDEQRKINQELEQLERDHQNKLKVIEQKGAADTAKAQQTIFAAQTARYKSMLDPIAQGFTSMLQGMYMRTMTWKQGLINIADSLVQGFIQKAVEMAEQWAVQELMKTTATTTGNAVRTASTAAAAGTSAAVTASAGMAQVTTNAAVGASGAFAATAPIPFVGPALAPGVAAMALAAILGFGAMIASASGGYDIPGGTNPLTQLHEKEMVLPAHIAEPLRASLRSGGPRAPAPLAAMSGAAASQMRSATSLHGGDTHLHYGPSYGGAQSQSLDQMLEKDGDRLLRYLKKAKRDGKMG